MPVGEIKMLKRTILLTLTLVITLMPHSSFAEVKTYTHTVRQPFGGSQAPDDARVAAIAKAKREVLEKAGTYLETLTIVRENIVAKDEILALAAGVLKAEIVSQKNYATEDAFGVVVVAEVQVDTSILEERVKKLLRDRSLLEKYWESQLREKELLARIKELDEQNKMLQNLSSREREQKKKDLKEQFKEVTRGLTAVDYINMALALLEQGKYTDPKQGLTYLDKSIRLDPNDATAYNLRGIAYYELGQHRRAIEDFDKAIRLGLNHAWAYSLRGIAYEALGQYERAIEDFDKAISLDPNLAVAYVGRGNAYFYFKQFGIMCEDYRRACRLGDCRGLKFANSRGYCH